MDNKALMNIEFRKAKSKEYSSTLIQKNMKAYYVKNNITWDPVFFDRHWTILENVEVYFDSERVGILRFSFDDENCYIRDLQIEQLYQGRGIGSHCLHYAFDIAKARGDGFIRLKVFSDNPAITLYQRHGFQKVFESGFLIEMALELNQINTLTVSV